MKRKPRTVRPPYHHGNLREALRVAALRALERDGVRELTLRGLARELGVSHAAPYAHFETKEALLEDLATAGFTRLRTVSRETLESTRQRPPRERLSELGVAYVSFGVANPELYRLMFGADASAAPSTALLEASRAAFQELARTVSDIPGSRPEDALGAWSLVHGLTSLLIDERLAGLPGTLKRNPADLARIITMRFGFG